MYVITFGSIHPWTHACTCSESGETYEHLSWKKAHHICEAQVQGGGLLVVRDGRKEGARGHLILGSRAGPIYPHSSVSSNLTLPLYQQLCFVSAQSFRPHSDLILRFISDIWSRHVEACTTHLVSVCDPFLRPPVCV